MSQQDSSNQYKVFELLFCVADLSTEQREATGIDNERINYVSVYSYRNVISNSCWFFKPEHNNAIYLNSDDWLELQLIKHLPWKDVFKFFIDKQEHINARLVNYPKS